MWDLVVTMDDATSEHTSMFFCDQEGTGSSFHGLGHSIARYGLFASLYSDRGSQYFTTPEAGGKVIIEWIVAARRCVFCGRCRRARSP